MHQILTTRTLLQISFKHILISITSFTSNQIQWEYSTIFIPEWLIRFLKSINKYVPSCYARIIIPVAEYVEIHIHDIQ
jgi:hypothetical protein